jgi:RHS repeat-associated protein
MRRQLDHHFRFLKSFMDSHARKLRHGILGLLVLFLLWMPFQTPSQSSPIVFALPITISGQGVAYDIRTNQIVATDYKNNVAWLVNLSTGVSTSVIVGTRPNAAAIYATLSKSYAYIGNEGSDSVSVIDLSTASVIKTIAVGQSPVSIAINVSTRKGYVANFKSDNVSILSLSNNTVAATTAVGSEPASVAINTATNTIYVANSKSDTVSVINGSSNAVMATIPVDQSPVYIDVNSVKSMAYAVNSKGNSISVIDLSTNAVTATIPVGSGPVSMAINIRKNIGYVADIYGDSVSVLDLSTNTVTGSYAVGRDPIRVAFFAPFLVVATQRGDGIWIINTLTQPFGTTVPVGKDPDGVAVDPATNRAVIANEKTNDVSIVDLATAQVSAIISVGGHPTAVAINSDTQTALAANEKDDTLSIIDLTSRNVIGTIAVGKSPVSVAINPNLNIGATANRKADSVSVIDLSNHNLIGTISVGRSPSAVAIQQTSNVGVVTSRKDNTASILDLSNLAVIATIAVGKDPTGVAIDSDLNLAVVANSKDNTASLIDLGSEDVIATVNVGKGPRGVGINSSTHRAAIANFIDGTITVIDLPSHQVVQTLSAGKSPQAVDINPNTNQAAVTLDSLNLLTLLQLDNPVPVISGLVPISISAGSPDFTLVVQGSQFITTSVVQFNGQNMATQFANSEKVSATIPASAITTAGTIFVTVTNPVPEGGTSNSVSFAINNPVPILDSVVPNAVMAGSPQGTLTVNGQMFVSGAVVSFAGQNLVTTFVNTTQLSAIVPAALMSQAGLFDINVINPGSGGVPSNTITFAVNNPVPATTSITPASIQLGAGNTALTVNGSNFVGSSTVQWNGISLPTTSASTVQLSTIIPANFLVSAGSFSITVANPAPGGGTSNPQIITVNNPVPSIATISPQTCAPGGGPFAITVNGANFLLSSVVTLNGQPLATTFATSTQLTATVPASYVATSQTAKIAVFNAAPGGGNSTELDLVVDQPPVADAGTIRSAVVGQAINLDGRKSSDADGDMITFAWSISAAPAGSTAQLTNPNSVTPSLMSDMTGTYQIQLVTSDGLLNSAPAFVTVTAGSPDAAPDADAGSDQTAVVGHVVTLDGRKSFDPDNNNITYQWRILSAPAESIASLTNADSVIASLTPDVAGIYVVQLVVNDGTTDSQPVQVTITATALDAAPIADAGKDRSVLTGSLVTLDGSKSRDPDAEPITYSWFFTSVPSGSSAMLSGATTIAPTFVPDQNGDYLIRLIVNDGTLDSEAATVLIRAAAPNPAPNAVVGSDQNVNQTDTVTLDSTGSMAPNGDQIAYSWQTISIPNGSQAVLSNITATNPTFVADQAGSYVFRLKVSDGVINSLPDTVVITADPVTQLTITPINPSIPQGQVLSFRAAATFGDETTKDVTSQATWTSSNPAVAAISAAGVATALTTGTTLIHASIGSVASQAQTLTVTNPTPVPIITDFSPKEGIAGTVVTIVGTNFSKQPTTVSINGIPLIISRVADSEIEAVVPSSTTSGLITVKTAVGSVNSSVPFNVQPKQDFSIFMSPSNISIPFNGQASSVVNLQSFGTGTFTGLVKLGLSTGGTDTLSGISAVFNPEFITGNQSSIMTVNLASSVISSSTITITAVVTLDGVIVTRTANLTIQPQGNGLTTISGRIVASKDLKPIQGVNLSIGSVSAVTDEAGNFLISNPPLGDQVVMINGDTANTPVATYPSAIPVPITVVSGINNSLPYRIYLHEVNTKHFTPINPTQDTLVTDPAVPDFEMRIPAGVQIIGWDGLPNTKVSFEIVSRDRLPIPPPPDNLLVQTIYMFYFGKPGGGTPTSPIPVKVPNQLGSEPGEKYNLYYYDEQSTPNPDSHQWKKFGTGTVSPDGRQIVTDPGVGIPKFCCGAIYIVAEYVPVPSPNPDDPVEGGEPVNLSTGIFIHRKTDIRLTGRIPVSIERTYRTMDYTQGPFGIGSTYNYDTRLTLASTGERMTYILPDGGKYYFPLQTDGTFKNTTSEKMYGSVALLNADNTRSLRFKDGTEHKFDSNGMLMEIDDPNGNAVTIGRQNGLVTSIAEPSGRSLRLSYDGIGRISSIEDPAGRTVQYSYNGSGMLAQVTDPNGGVISYTYDSQNRMQSIKDARDKIILQNFYDTYDRVSKQINVDGGIFTFYYFGLGTPVSVLPPLYSFGNCTPIFIREGETPPSGGCGTIVVSVPSRIGVPSYSTATNSINQTIVIDPNGNYTTYRFDGQGYLLSETDQLGGYVSYVRQTGTNLLLSVTDKLGRTTSFTHDLNGNLASVTDPDGNATYYEYNMTFNKLTKITDAMGNITTLAYDTQGNLTELTSPGENITSIGYNQFGQPVSVTDALNNVTSFAYNASGDLITTTDPLGDTTRRDYDSISRLIDIIDAKGSVTLYHYDNLNRINTITDTLGNITTLTYDPNGNILAVQDAKNQTISYTYDGWNNISSMTDQLGQTETYQYDGNQNVTKYTDRKGQATTLTYDNLNRKKSATFEDGSSITYVYDAGGRLTGVTDSESGIIHYGYDNLDRVINEITSLGSIDYTYDAIGRRTSMIVSGQPTVNYSYNTDSFLSAVNTIINGSAAAFKLQIDAIGRRSSLALPNGVTTTYDYDNASRLSNVTYLNPFNVILDSIEYTYNANGNRTSANRASINMLSPNQATNINYNLANQMLTSNDKTISYDMNGNILSVLNTCGATNYTWDARNRLIGINGYSADCSTLTASFTYDAIGRRIEKTINGKATQYFYDGYDIVQELTGGAVSANYIRSLNIDEPLARVKSDGTVRYYHHDGIGSVVDLTDESGAIKTQYSYDPFGSVALSGESKDSPFQFTGRENDGTGLYYYRARYYDPELQRFISEDPIGLRGGINKFAYVGNNPLSFRDPYGLITQGQVVGGVLIGTGLVIATGGFGVVGAGVVALGEAGEAGLGVAIGEFLEGLYGGGMMVGAGGTIVAVGVQTVTTSSNQACNQNQQNQNYTNLRFENYGNQFP